MDTKNAEVEDDFKTIEKIAKRLCTQYQKMKNHIISDLLWKREKSRVLSAVNKGWSFSAVAGYNSRQELELLLI